MKRNTASRLMVEQIRDLIANALRKSDELGLTKSEIAEGRDLLRQVKEELKTGWPKQRQK